MLRGIGLREGKAEPLLVFYTLQLLPSPSLQHHSASVVPPNLADFREKAKLRDGLR
jgi:hypothetical protein